MVNCMTSTYKDGGIRDDPPAFAPGKENAAGGDVDGSVGGLGGLDAEQRIKLLLPLAEQRARHDDEDPRGPLR